MKNFQKFSLKQKLLWISIIAGILTVILATIGLMSYERVTYRKNMVEELSTQAEIIGYNASSALVFNDPISAQSTLSALKAKTGITSAGIYNAQGQLFATYFAIEKGTMPETLSDLDDRYFFEQSHLEMFKRIMLEGEFIGVIYLQHDLKAFKTRLALYAIIVIGVFVITQILSFFVVSLLQQKIIHPLIGLTKAAQVVSDKKDYSIRVEKESQDEIGSLVDGFNEMLTQIQARDIELQKARDGLEVQVKDRTRDLEQEIQVRKIAEVALRDSEDKWRRLFEEALDAIFVADTVTGEILDCNYAATILIGRSKQEIIGQLQRILHPQAEAGEQFSDTFKKHRTDAEGRILEAQVITKDGTIKDVEIRASIINLGGKKVLQGAFRDISERKIAEQKLQHAMEELARSNSELQQFAYVASHDLQEPLRMVASFSQLLEKRYKDKLGKEADEFIGFVVDGANRMQLLINDLLQYSRVGTRGRPFESIDMNVILGQAITNLRIAIEESKAIITNTELPVVVADETQMTQLMQNLIGNAIKFSKESYPNIHIAAHQEQDEWVFSVKDNGIGISPEYYERIFIIFQRLHNRTEYSGTGIGLAICKRIIDRHGGKIWVTSEPENGSTFYFTIPIRERRV
jgi:PAS domain S-box-containing protein